MGYLIAIVLMIIVIFSLVVNTRKKAKQSIVFTPSSMSLSRVENLNLKLKSDKELGILDERKLVFPPALDIKPSDSYRGTPAIEWIIDITPPKDFSFSKNEFLEVFDYEWRVNFKSEFYAYFPSSQTWSFAISADSPESFTSLELAIPRAPFFEKEELTLKRLQSYIDELGKKLNQFEVEMEITPRESLEIALEKSKKLRQIQNDLNIDVIAVLQSESEFKSKDFWNVLVDLGLTWGDGDIFHWTNHNREIGDDSFFSVWTTTDPGYFFPEDIANGKMEPQDLIFGFSIPRSSDPYGVFEAMVESVKFCQARLGGQILDENGELFDRNRYMTIIDEQTKKMSDYGFSQGQGLIMRLI